MAETELFCSIAGIRLRIRAYGAVDWTLLADYAVNPGKWDQDYEIVCAEQLEEDPGDRICTQGDFWISIHDETRLRYIGAITWGVDGAYLRICRCGRETQLQFRRSNLIHMIPGKYLLRGLELEHLLTVHSGFLLHASYIEWQGRAILFTAPSETGKSTQARLWCDHAGAELVNGDRAAVRIMDGAVYACGTPFSGSSPVRRNVTRPLAAIVYLSQAPENTITRLKGVRAFRRVWEGCTVNTWDREDVEKATKTVSEVVSRIPVHHLACTPDIRAVELLKHTMEVEK